MVEDHRTQTLHFFYVIIITTNVSPHTFNRSKWLHAEAFICFEQTYYVMCGVTAP